MRPLTSDPPAIHILLVENHADTLRCLTMFLEQMGYAVVAVGSMQEALSAVRTAHCDVLISDIGLPDGDGWELLRAIKEGGLPRPFYAIAMTGFDERADRERSRVAGFRHHILKPFDLGELEVMLEEAALEREQERSEG